MPLSVLLADLLKDLILTKVRNLANWIIQTLAIQELDFTDAEPQLEVPSQFPT